jgi:hypothetical protein
MSETRRRWLEAHGLLNSPRYAWSERKKWVFYFVTLLPLVVLLAFTMPIATMIWLSGWRRADLFIGRQFLRLQRWLFERYPHY